jgi:pSer/pThr/pTyr-binding forkhead associated (FHA) protein
MLISTDHAQRELKLSLPATVGRGRDAKVKVIHSKVSRLHCEFFEQDGVLYVRDLDSTNGTFVGDQKVEGPTPIRPGETVTIGEVHFEAMYELGAGAVLPPVAVNAAADTVRKVGSEATFRARPTAASPKPADSTADADSAEFQLQDLPPATDEAPVIADDSDEFQLMPLDEETKNEDTKVDESFDPTAWLNEPDDAEKSPPAKSPPKQSPPGQAPKKKSADEDDLDDFLKSLE